MTVDFNKLVKYSKSAYSYFNNVALTEKSIKDNTMYTGPWSAYLMLTNKCNCKCIHCFPQIAEKAKKEDNTEVLTVEEYYSLIDQLIKARCYKIVCAGGEPLIYKDKLLKILKKINEKAFSQISTNGLLIDENFLQSYSSLGGGHINLSVDGLNEAHDYIRGTTGLFAKLEDVIDIYQKARFKNILFRVSFVLFNKNVQELIPVINYFIARKIPVQIQPYESQYDSDDPLWIKKEQEEELEASLEETISIKEKHPDLIINSKAHLSAIRQYYLNPGMLHKKCYFGYRWVYIFPNGEIGTCMNYNIDSIRNNSFFSIWNSPEFHETRKIQLSCDRNCLIGCTIDPSLFERFKLYFSLEFNPKFKKAK